VAHFAKKRSPQKAPKVHEGTARKNVAIHGVRVRASMVKLGHHALCFHVVVVVVKGRWFEADDASRLWRRAHFPMVHCRGIIAPIMVHVCDGGTGKM
jgi:hypothetical protein